MEHHIKNQAGDTIASFGQVQDRDICYDAFMDYWGDDCGLEKVSDPE